MSYEQRIEDMPTEKDWNSYGAEPITKEARETALNVTSVPTSDGGIQLEWHQDGANTEVVIGSSGAIIGVYWGKA
jgi:hypothetical protein